MRVKKFSTTIPSVRMFLMFIIFNLHANLGETCSSMGRNFGERAAANMREGMRESTQAISHALENSVWEVNESIRSALNNLEGISAQLTDSLDHNTAELMATINKATGDLVSVADKVTNSVDRGVEEIGSTLREAIDTTRNVATVLTKSLDNAVTTVGKNIENVSENLRKVISDLTGSIDNSVEKLGDTLKYVADRVVEVSKQFNMRIDSHDLVSVASVTKEGLVESIKELTRNWHVAISTADLRDVGQSAAAEVAKAMQNIQARVTVKIEMDDNWRLSILYISIAGGFAFSVLFIALVMTLKSCRSCLIHLCSFVAARGSRSVDDDDSADEEVGKIRRGSRRGQLNNSLEMKELRGNKSTQNPQVRILRREQRLNSSSDDDLDLFEVADQTPKAGTMSCRDVNVQKLTRKYEREVQRKTSQRGPNHVHRNLLHVHNVD